MTRGQGDMDGMDTELSGKSSLCEHMRASRTEREDGLKRSEIESFCTVEILW